MNEREGLSYDAYLDAEWERYHDEGGPDVCERCRNDETEQYGLCHSCRAQVRWEADEARAETQREGGQ